MARMTRLSEWQIRAEWEILERADGDAAPGRRSPERGAGEATAFPDREARIADYRHHAALLREAYGPILDEPVPDRLRDTLRRAETVHHGPRLARVAAVVALMGMSGAMGWLAGHDLRGPHDSRAPHAGPALQSGLPVQEAPPRLAAPQWPEHPVEASPSAFNAKTNPAAVPVAPSLAVPRHEKGGGDDIPALPTLAVH